MCGLVDTLRPLLFGAKLLVYSCLSEVFVTRGFSTVEAIVKHAIRSCEEVRRPISGSLTLC